ncbi:DUF6318 family protein [Arthrobacter koreensis]|uniref:DUF6318 family protein n=1 Tax=Arthrobacter koreensis TaxID=199136 RepID=UPI003ACC1EAF
MSSLGVRRQFAAVSLALAGVLVLGACSGSDEPDADAAQSPSSSVSPSTSSTPSPTPTATYKPASAEGPAENVPLPEMPEEAKVESKEGLVAFARYWYEAAAYGYETGEVGPLKEISGPDCTACNGAYSTLATWFEDGGWTVGGQIEVTSAASEYALTESGNRQALVMFKQVPIDVYGPEGLIRTVGQGDAYVQLIDASFRDGSWIAMDVVTMKQMP